MRNRSESEEVDPGDFARLEEDFVLQASAKSDVEFRQILFLSELLKLSNRWKACGIGQLEDGSIPPGQCHTANLFIDTLEG